MFTLLKQEGVKAEDREQEILSLGAAEFFDLGNPEQQKKEKAGSVDFLLLTADSTNMPYDLYMSLVRKRGTLVMLGLPNDQV
ncbi:NADP-dependent alcohol dehydrogenase C 2 [Phytophthora cinnamomi]|uniref:NADP-dependent alcohol dehydrogenase C 2 n=1 Tax=Phytophthora cinnamomi TaxID=4785 RepID=UPI00355A3F56|nr:NADP-dependent alcohol dehydrogenase C 2 [Phytophthora cinnamomi]